MPRNARGQNLDQKLEKLLAEMLTQGFENAPISRTSVQELLRLKSRGTLVGTRGEKIDAARAAQFHFHAPRLNSALNAIFTSIER